MSTQAVGHRIPAGRPLLSAEVGRSLSAAGVPSRDEDKTPTATAVVSAPTSWTFSNETCWYARAFIEAIPTDTPFGGRHHWMLGKTIRLACAYRMGCVTEADHKAAVDALAARFTEVLASTQPARAPRPREFAGLINDGIDRAAAKTDEQARSELKDHTHNDWMALVPNTPGPQTAPGPQAAAPAPGPQQAQAAPAPGPQAAQAAAAKPKAVPIATELVALAEYYYTFGVGDDGTPYAADKKHPHIALPLRGGPLSLRTELSKRFHAAHKGAVPSSNALTNALVVLEGMCMEHQPEELHLRVAQHDGRVYVDPADSKGRVIEIGGGRWQFITDVIPVMFRRTKQTATMPEPKRGGKLSQLWKYVRIAPADRPILVAALVSALIQPDVPHVVLAFITEHGSAKSSSAKCIVSLIDPSNAPLQMPPRDAESWVTTANGSYVVAVDNVSTIPDWWSDSLCRASTGEGYLKRSLYTDTDLTVLKFRRVILLNGIDLGGLREDLTDRLAPVDLMPITQTDRKTEARLAAEWELDRPVILGGLLDLAAQVHAALPAYNPTELPRMADFARALGCIDAMHRTAGLAQYEKRATHLAAEGLESDPWMARLMTIAMLHPRRFTDISASDILANVTSGEYDNWGNEQRPKSWPLKPRTVTTKLQRAAPALRSLGWRIENDNGQNKAGATRWTIHPPQATP